MWYRDATDQTRGNPRGQINTPNPLQNPQNELLMRKQALQIYQDEIAQSHPAQWELAHSSVSFPFPHVTGKGHPQFGGQGGRTGRERQDSLLPSPPGGFYPATAWFRGRKKLYCQAKLGFAYFTRRSVLIPEWKIYAQFEVTDNYSLKDKVSALTHC